MSKSQPSLHMAITHESSSIFFRNNANEPPPKPPLTRQNCLGGNQSVVTMSPALPKKQTRTRQLQTQTALTLQTPIPQTPRVHPQDHIQSPQLPKKRNK